MENDVQPVEIPSVQECGCSTAIQGVAVQFQHNLNRRHPDKLPEGSFTPELLQLHHLVISLWRTPQRPRLVVI